MVLDESRNVVDIIKTIAEFFAHESCGYCTLCREGTPRLVEIISKIHEGKGSIEDILVLEKLGKVTSYASLCGLGQAAPNPILSSLKHFYSDYTTRILK